MHNKSTSCTACGRPVTGRHPHGFCTSCAARASRGRRQFFTRMLVAGIVSPELVARTIALEIEQEAKS